MGREGLLRDGDSGLVRRRAEVALRINRPNVIVISVAGGHFGVDIARGGHVRSQDYEIAVSRTAIDLVAGYDDTRLRRRRVPFQQNSSWFVGLGAPEVHDGDDAGTDKRHNCERKQYGSFESHTRIWLPESGRPNFDAGNVFARMIRPYKKPGGLHDTLVAERNYGSSF
jgi:hypothetical protein